MRKKSTVNAYEDPVLDSIYNKKRSGERLDSATSVKLDDDPRLVEIYNKKPIEQVQKFKTNKSIRNENN